MADASDPKSPDRDDAKDATAPRQPWRTPKVIASDARLTMHGNCGGVDGVFSSS
jgi:hypothetical protein